MFSNDAKRDNKKGFSLIEVIIATILLIGVISVVFTMTMAGIKASRTSQTLTDLRILSLQKLGDINNNLSKELKKIPLGENSIGSIDPTNPVQGYFDLLNENGCTLNATKVAQVPIKTVSSTNKGANGDAIEGGSGGIKDGRDTGNLGENFPEVTENTIDCSKATFGKTNNSTIPRYRRQWVITKNKPSQNDNVVSIVIFDLVTNQIVRSETTVKVDGITKANL